MGVLMCILAGVLTALLVRPASKEIEQFQTTTTAIPFPLPTCDVEKVVKFNSTGRCKTNFTSIGNYAGTGSRRSYVDGNSVYLAKFLGATGIGIHPDGSLIIADQIRMRGVIPGTVFTRPYLNSGLSLKQFSLDSNGTMYVPVASRYIVAVKTKTNVETIIAGSNSSSRFLDNSNPLKARFVDPLQTVYRQRKLYILDRISTTSAAIRVIDFCPYTLNPGVRTILNFTNPAQLPQAMAFDDERTLYYSTSNHCINKYFLANRTTVTCFVGIYGVAGSTNGSPGVGRLSTPLGLAFDKCGNLFVADSGPGYIRVVDKAGTLTTAGVIANYGSANGRTGCMVFDELGDLFLTDLYSPIIRKVGW